MNEDFPVDNNKEPDTKYDQPKIGEPGIDPAGLPDNTKEIDGILDKPREGVPAFDPAGLPHNIKDPVNKDFKESNPPIDFADNTIDNINPDKDPNDYNGPDGGDTIPPLPPNANTMPLPPEMDPKTPPPIQQMPREPFINLEEGQQK